MYKIKRETLMCISFDTHHSIKNRYTLELDKTHILNGSNFFSETRTPKSKKTGNFGKAKTHFYRTHESPMFETIELLLESLGLDINDFKE